MSSAKFRAEISDFKVVYNILKAILFREVSSLKININYTQISR